MSAAIVATKNVNIQKSYLWILVAAISALTIKGTKEMKKRWTEAENLRSYVINKTFSV